MKRRCVLLFLLFSTHLIATPTEDNLSNRSIEEIFRLSFDQPQILQDMTKKNLEILPEFETVHEKAIAILVETQVRAQVERQVKDKARDRVWAQVWDQVVDRLLGTQVERQVRHQLSNQVGAQVWVAVWVEVRNQVGDQVEKQILKQVFCLLRGIYPLYLNMRSSQDERDKFINAIIPFTNKTISTYHYFFVKRLLEPSEDVTKMREDGSRMTILESIVDQFKDQIMEDDIDLNAIYNAATPDGWEEMNPNIKNFLLPRQRYSQPDAN